MPNLLHRRAYLKYRDRQRLQKEEDRRTIEELHSRLKHLECERSDLEKRVELLQKVRILRALAGSPWITFAPPLAILTDEAWSESL